MYIFFFGLLVSFDAFVCGLSLGHDKFKKTAFYTIYSAVIGFIGSYLFSMFGEYLGGIIDIKVSTICAGSLLIIISLFSFFEGSEIIKLNFVRKKSELFFKLSACSIVAVDASFAALSLSLMGYDNYFYIAAVFGIMHGIMAFLGILVSENRFFKIISEKIELLPTFIMLLLGISKLI